MAISKRLRFEILRRDGFACKYCHRDKVIITVDHVIPRTLGGTDHPSNLVASCDDCNAGKTSALPGGRTVGDVNEDLIHWARAVKRPAQDDWDARETEAVVNAAVHVWQSYWMPEHQADPTPELVADFRRKALELYPEEFGADDLMLAAQTSAEHALDDLRDALEFAELSAQCDSPVPQADTALMVEAAIALWRKTWLIIRGGEEPPVELKREVRAEAKRLYPAQLDAIRLLRGAEYAGGDGTTDILGALREMADIDAFQAVESDFDRSVIDMAVRVWEKGILSGGREPKPAEIDAVRESAMALYPGSVGAGPIIRAAYDTAQWDDTDLSHGLGRDDYLEVEPFHLLVASSFFRGWAEGDSPKLNPIDAEGWTNILRQAFAARDAGYNDDAILQGAYFAGRHGRPLATQMTTADESLKNIGSWYEADLKECSLNREELDRAAQQERDRKAEADRRAVDRAAAGDPWYADHPAHPNNAVTNAVSNTSGGA